MWQTNDVKDIPQVEVPEEYSYISSDDTKKDVRVLNTEYLINALAKCYREIFSQTANEAIEKYRTNIISIENELCRRVNKFIEIKESY